MLALELLFVVIPYLLTVTHFAMWWAGWSPPARFFAPVLQLFAVPAAAAWTFAGHRAARALRPRRSVLTICASTVVVVVDRGRLAFNTRDAPSLWFEWMGRLADLTAATPMWARDADAPLFRAIALWLIVGAGGWVLLRALDRHGRLRQNVTFHLVVTATLAGIVMVASSVMWAFQGTNGRTASPSQLELLETVSSQDRAVALSSIRSPGWRSPECPVVSGLSSRGAWAAARPPVKSRRSSRCRRFPPGSIVLLRSPTIHGGG